MLCVKGLTPHLCVESYKFGLLVVCPMLNGVCVQKVVC